IGPSRTVTTCGLRDGATRTGATTGAGRVTVPAWSTSYSFANSVAPAGAVIRSRTVADPVSWTGAGSRADLNAANCPGMSMLTPELSPRSWPTPGNEEIAAGTPPAGLTTAWLEPERRTACWRVPPRPGYRAAAATPNDIESSVGSNPRAR